MHHATLPSLRDIFNIVNQLSLKDKSALMEFLQQTVQPNPYLETQKRNIYDLKGIGKESWKETDAQEYVNQERDSWD